MPVEMRRRKKPSTGRAGSKSKNRHAEPREAFHLSVDLQLALELAAVSSEPPSGKSATIRFALERFLTERKLFPPTDAKLKQLLSHMDLDRLSDQARKHLKDRGIV